MEHNEINIRSQLSLTITSQPNMIATLSCIYLFGVSSKHIVAQCLCMCINVNGIQFVSFPLPFSIPYKISTTDSSTIKCLARITNKNANAWNVYVYVYRLIDV